MRKLTFIISSLLIFSVHLISAQSSESVYHFLSLPSSSHVAALGGTNVSMYDDDLNFTLHNPGLLGLNMHNQLSLNGTSYLSDINFGSAAYSHKLNDLNLLAAGVLFVDYGDFTERNEYNEELGKFSATDVALFLMYGRVLSERWTLGATLKPIFSSYEKYSSFGLGVDVGISYKNKDKLLGMGFVLKNIGRQLDGYYKSEGKQHIESFPFEIQAGITKKLNHAPFRFSITLHNLQRWDMGFTDKTTSTTISGTTTNNDDSLSFGENLMRHFIFDVEFLPTENFYIAIGYNYKRNRELKVLDNKSINGFSFGAGLKVYKFNLGFAFAKYHPSANSLHFSISTNLNSFNF